MTVKYLSRDEAAEYVRARGLPCAKLTLQKYASVGGGPAFQKFGSRVVYTPAGLDDWIKRKLTKPITSTSQSA